MLRKVVRPIILHLGHRLLQVLLFLVMRVRTRIVNLVDLFELTFVYYLFEVSKVALNGTFKQFVISLSYLTNALLLEELRKLLFKRKLICVVFFKFEKKPLEILSLLGDSLF